MASGEDVDSGMESQNSKSETPEKCQEIQDFDDDDEDDETLSERLWGLTEMFPEPVRNFTESVYNGIIKTIQASYSLSRQATWVVCSSSLVLFAPVMFEVERANTQEALRRDKQQVLLGPTESALSGGISPLR